MQTALSRGCQGAIKPLDSRRSAARVPAFGTTTSRRTSVQVFAKKGKGKPTARGSMPGQNEVMRKEPPTPEVDPENAEFVIFMRCLKYTDPTLNVLMGPSRWVPINILKGNNALNFVAKSLQSEWGMKLYGRTLIWQIATGLYQEKAALEKKMRQEIPIFANVSSDMFEYSFKIRDKANPKDWMKAEGLTMLPPKEEVKASGLDALKSFFSVETLTGLFTAPEAPSTPAQQ